jgi:hypothetical protein
VSALRVHPIIEPASNVRLLRPIRPTHPAPEPARDRTATITLTLTDIEWSLLMADLRRPDAPAVVHDLGHQIATQARRQIGNEQ